MASAKSTWENPSAKKNMVLKQFIDQYAFVTTYANVALAGAATPGLITTALIHGYTLSPEYTCTKHSTTIKDINDQYFVCVLMGTFVNASINVSLGPNE